MAYLAPEIPALSATFVYKEILALEALGTEVVSFSVHRPHVIASESELDSLKKNVHYLYELSFLAGIFANFNLLFKHPFNYIKTIGLLLADIVSLGVFSRHSLALSFRFFNAANLAARLKLEQCQHLHVHFAHVPTDIAMYASSLAGISFSVTAHANDLFERGWLLGQKVERSAFFGTISEFNKAYIAKQGVDIEKVKIIRCGVDEKQFDLRAGFVSNPRVKIGVVGRLVEKKGIDSLIKAVASVGNIELYIAGSGPLESELKQLVDNCSLTSQDVTFLGAMPHDQVSTFIRSLDVFILPCKVDSNGDMDGIPVVLMEAMLSGVPVISTKISGIPELILDGNTGILAEPNNEESLAKALRKMIENDVLREEMIQRAVNKVKADFSLAGNVKKLNELFMNIVQNHANRE